ncbi:MAG: hypothetical protein ACRELD_01010 [Longimicrobiales bacterium]
MHGSELIRDIRLAGLLHLIAFAALVPISFGLAPVSPREIEQPRELDLLQRFSAAMPLPADARDALARYVSGDSPLTEPAIRLLVYFGPLLLATLAAVYVAWRIARAPDRIDCSAIRNLTGFACGAALISVFALPAFTQDFWLSVIWGRMIGAGANPYYDAFTTSAMAGLPVEDFGDRMTYGPAWGLVAAFLAALGGSSVWLTFLLFKLTLAGCWIGTLFLLRREARTRSPLHEALTVVFFGWLPVSAHLTIGEGHNDIVMAFFMVFWLFCASRPLRWSGWAMPTLFVSALVKYVTAPLAALELLIAWRQRRLTDRRYLLRAGVSILAAAGLMLLFARDTHVLDATRQMQNWVFWTPGVALASLARMAGVPLTVPIATAVFAGLGTGLLLYYLAALFRNPDAKHLARASLAVMALILFVVVGHVWPWFVLWVLPLAALIWETRLAAFILAFAVAAPLLSVDWLIESAPRLGLITYLTAVVLMVAIIRWTGRFSTVAPAAPSDRRVAAPIAAPHPSS